MSIVINNTQILRPSYLQRESSNGFCKSLKEKIKAIWDKIYAFFCCIFCCKRPHSQSISSQTKNVTESNTQASQTKEGTGTVTNPKPPKPFVRPTQTSKIKQPEAITAKILSFLSLQDVMSFEQTCTDTQKDCKNKALWKGMFDRYFPDAKVPLDSCSKEKFKEFAKRTVYINPTYHGIDKTCKAFTYYLGITKLSTILKKASLAFNKPMSKEDLYHAGYLWGRSSDLIKEASEVGVGSVTWMIHGHESIPDDILCSDIDKFAKGLDAFSKEQKEKGHLFLNFGDPLKSHQQDID